MTGMTNHTAKTLTDFPIGTRVVFFDEHDYAHIGNVIRHHKGYCVVDIVASDKLLGSDVEYVRPDELYYH